MDFSKKFVLAAETVSEYTVQKGEERHRMMIFDGHSDLLYDVTRRRLAGEDHVLERRHLSGLRAGGIGGLGLSLWTTAEEDGFWTEYPKADGWQRTELMMDCARAELTECPWLVPVRTAAEARRAAAEGKRFTFLVVEGMEPVGDRLERIDQYAAWGVRLGMLTWNEENQLACGAGGDPDRGLTPLGREAMRRMQARGILPDVSHTSDRSFWDILKLAEGPVVASHSNCRALCDVRRNLTDEQLRAIRDTGGVIGVNVYHGFVHAEPRMQTAAMLARHAAHIAETIGPEHVACGFDFCEYFGPGNEGCEGMENCAQTGNFFFELERLGFSAAERQGIASENLLRVLE